MAKHKFLLVLMAAVLIWVVLAVWLEWPARWARAERPFFISSSGVYSPDADTYVAQGAPTDNFGSASLLEVSRNQTGNLCETLLHFDLSTAIPPEATISNAVLYLYHQRGTGPDETLSVYGLSAGWSEGTVTWNTRPGHGRSPYDSKVVGTAAGTYSWDVTAAVQAWVNGGVSNYGLTVLCSSSDVYVRYFASRETQNTQIRPYLVVDFTVPTRTPTPTRQQVPTATPTATATQPQCPDSYEPNSSFAQAWFLNPGESPRSYICCWVTALDTDYFKFRVNTGDHVDVWLTSLPVDYNLCIYTPGQTLVQCSANAGTLDEHVSFDAQQTGDYYAYVYGVQGTCDSAKPYVLRISLVSATPTQTGVPTQTSTRTASPTTTPTRTASPTATQTRTPTSVPSTFYASFSLHIDDAAEGVIVNKVAGDASGYGNSTRVDVVAKIFGLSNASSVSVILTVPGDLFGTPWSVFVRDSSGDEGVGAFYQNLGGGRYKVTTTLSSYNIGLLNWHRRQIVWRFDIPNNALPQTLVLQAELQVPGYTPADPSGAATLRILENANSLVLVNRTALYNKYVESQVTSLLQHVYADVQGWPYSTAPTGIVYNVDMYDGSIREWNNATVNYASENTANVVARLIADLIKDWYDDATRYVSIPIPLVGTILLPVDVPHYLMIVGDDTTIPFYRCPDPFTDEVDWNWTASTNPAIHATDHGYIFTDNAYADITGNDWKLGNVELWTGRIVGETAADMLTLLDNGMTHQTPTGRAVMASVDGWELGWEPDDGRSGEIADLYNVPSLLAVKGWQVLNDSESPHTLDVMGSYPSNWLTGFRAAANGGMDVFFIGGHDNPDGAGIPGGDGFSADDTPGKYTRFGADHPLALITGCHGGLPVLSSTGIPGGANGNMVYDLAHEGVRGYIGATGFSYGSPGNLHVCTWGERFIQLFFRKLTLPGGGNSMAIGKALADTKNDYVFGMGGDDGLDHKTVIEYQLYGAPWTYLLYPGGGSAALGVNEGAPTPAAERGSVVQASSTVYQQTFTVNVPPYGLAYESQGGIAYAIFSVPGGLADLSPGYPRLPYMQGFTLTLPFSATLQNVELLSTDSQSIGNFTVPTVLVKNWDAGGATYTTTTSINYPYPSTLVTWQQLGDSLSFTVFPIQHNPTSHQTWSYSRFQVRVTYDAPLPVGISALYTDKASYVPGENMQVTANLVNVGLASTTLSATLTIEDLMGIVLCKTQATPFVVAAGGTYAWNASCSVAQEGSYSARVTLWQSGSIVGGAATPLAVQGGGITALTGPTSARLGQSAAFRVTYTNYRGQAVSAQFHLVIEDVEGTVYAELPAQTLTVPGGGSQVATFNWTPGEEHAGRDLRAVTTVTVQGQTVGPSTLPFVVTGTELHVYLPMVLKSTP